MFTYEDHISCVGEGWQPLVRTLIQDITAMGWDGELVQIKEKFGGLRFYIGSASKEIHDRISEAERQADVTCEQCGAPGELRNTSWWKTLCDTCHETRLKERQARGLDKDL